MDELSFETAFAELEATVQRLEEGNLPLDEAVALYERGVALARVCAAQLDAAELRVAQLSQAPADGAAEDDAPSAWPEEEPF